MKQDLGRVMELSLAFAAFLFVALCYLSWRNLGFPDGYLTELGSTLSILYPVYMLVGTGFGTCFIINRTVLGHSRQRRFIRLTAFLFLCFLAFTATLHFLLPRLLENGTGG